MVPIQQHVQQAASLPRSEPAPDVAELAAAMLRALTQMAAYSPRRQADLGAALRGAGLVTDPAMATQALRLLRDQGCIANLIPLADGGLLLTVTGLAVGHASAVPKWFPTELRATPEAAAEIPAAEA